MFYKNRPKITIPISETNRLLNWIIGLLLMVYFSFIFVQFKQLPETIPTHFGSGGLVDDYGSKNTIWLLPVIASIISIGMGILKNYPHLMNYPIKVTEENAPRLYAFGINLLQFSTLFVILIFMYISYATITVAKNPTGESINSWFAPFVIISSVIFSIFVLVKINSLK